MPTGLKRFHQTRGSHFVTFSCYRRQPNFSAPDTYDLFVRCLEDMRRRFGIRIYGYVVMPEHYALREVGVMEIESQWTARDREASETCVGTRVFLCPG